jgi:hypothetical protein
MMRAKKAPLGRKLSKHNQEMQGVSRETLNYCLTARGVESIFLIQETQMFHVELLWLQLPVIGTLFHVERPDGLSDRFFYFDCSRAPLSYELSRTSLRDGSP